MRISAISCDAVTMIGSAVVFSRISLTSVSPSRSRASVDRRRSMSATSKRSVAMAERADARLSASRTSTSSMRVMMLTR